MGTTVEDEPETLTVTGGPSKGSATAYRKPPRMNLAQLVLDQQVSCSENTRLGRLWAKSLEMARARLISHGGDPVVCYQLYDNRSLFLPLSHELPIFRKRYPGFLENIGRLAKLIQDYFHRLIVVDIGANIGDSAAVIRHHADCSLLCIEASQRYYDLLQRNIAGQPSVLAVRALVGRDGRLVGALKESRGTGRFVRDDRESLQALSLSTIISDHPEFSGFKLLKIDTDGFDLEILMTEIKLLQRSKPVLFFEYDPSIGEMKQHQRLAALAALKSVGYFSTLIYSNSGEFLMSTTLHCHETLRDLDRYLGGRSDKSLAYFDLCVFHEDDLLLSEYVRDRERSYFDIDSLD